MEIKKSIKEIKKYADQGKLVLFIGSGVSRNSGYPSWEGLVREFDKVISYSEDPSIKKYSSDEMLKIPQYAFSNEAKYYEVLLEQFKLSDETQNPILDSLMSLNPQHIITTNYDNLIELAIERYNPLYTNEKRAFEVIHSDNDLVDISSSHLLIKMHGDLRDIENIVLKEDDYLTYSETHKLIETYIKSLLVNHSFVFVGYSLSDTNLKLIMSWVDNLVKNSKETNRKPHFFINPEGKLSDYEVDYYNKKNIKIINSFDIPDDFKTKKHYDSDVANNLNRICEYISRTSYYYEDIDEIISNLKFLDIMNYIDAKSVLKILSIPEYCYFDINGIVQTDFGHLGEKEAIKNLLKDDRIHEVENALKKTHISRLCVGDNVIYSKIKESTLSQHFFKFNYTKLKELEKDLNSSKKPLDKLRKLFLQGFFEIFLADSKPVEEYSNLLREFKKENNLFQQTICCYNCFMHCMTERAMFFNVKDVMDEEEKQAYGLLNRYFDGMNNLYVDIVNYKSTIANQLTPYTHHISRETKVKNLKYKSLRSQLEDILTYFNENNMYFSTICGSEQNISKLKEAIYEFNDLSLYFISPKSKMKYKTRGEIIEYERTELNDFNLFALVFYCSKEQLSLLLKKHEITNLRIDIERIDCLIEMADNLTEYINSEYLLHYQISSVCKLLENIFLLLNYVEFTQEQIDSITNIFSKLILVLNHIESDYNYTMCNNSIINILTFWMDFCQKNKSINADCIFIALRNVIDQFSLDKNNIPYILDLLNKINIIGNVAITIKEDKYTELTLEDDYVESSLIKFETKFPQYYYKFLYQIYPLCYGKKKLEICTYLSRHISQATSADICNMVWFGVNVDKILLERRIYQLCQSYSGNFENDTSNPLYTIVVLYNKKILDDVYCFKEFKNKYLLFDFVCFPGEFDYNKFDINWSDYLNENPYKEYALSNKEILYPKYLEAMNEGPTDHIKRIYYKYFYKPEI